MQQILKPVTYTLAALYFLADAAFIAIAKPDIRLACQACRAQTIARLDQIIATLPIIGAAFGAGDHAGTGQTGGGLSGCDRSDGEQCCDIDRRRASKARLGRAFVQPYPGQTDENSRLCMGLHKFREAKAWLTNTEAWQAIRAISRSVRQYLTEVKKSAAVALRHSSESR